MFVAVAIILVTDKFTLERGDSELRASLIIQLGKPPALLGETRISFTETTVTGPFSSRPREKESKPMRDHKSLSHTRRDCKYHIETFARIGRL